MHPEERYGQPSRRAFRKPRHRRDLGRLEQLHPEPGLCRVLRERRRQQVRLGAVLPGLERNDPCPEVGILPAQRDDRLRNRPDERLRLRYDQVREVHQRKPHQSRLRQPRPASEDVNHHPLLHLSRRHLRHRIHLHPPLAIQGRHQGAARHQDRHQLDVLLPLEEICSGRA